MCVWDPIFKILSGSSHLCLLFTSCLCKPSRSARDGKTRTFSGHTWVWPPPSMCIKPSRFPGIYLWFQSPIWTSLFPGLSFLVGLLFVLLLTPQSPVKLGNCQWLFSRHNQGKDYSHWTKSESDQLRQV